MNEQEITFEGTCPCCGVLSEWTAQQLGIYPDVRSRITRIDHGVKP